MLSNFVEKIKTHKKAIVVVVLFTLAILLLIINDYNKLKENEIQEPVTVSPTIKEDKYALKLLNVDPPSGEVSTLNSFQDIMFEFSAPIDIDSVAMRILPTTAYNKDVVESKPNVLIVSPLSMGWEPYLKYTIIISSLEGFNGESLVSKVRHEYLNIPPDLSNTPQPY